MEDDIIAMSVRTSFNQVSVRETTLNSRRSTNNNAVKMAEFVDIEPKFKITPQKQKTPKISSAASSHRNKKPSED